MAQVPTSGGFRVGGMVSGRDATGIYEVLKHVFGYTGGATLDDMNTWAKANLSYSDFNSAHVLTTLANLDRATEWRGFPNGTQFEVFYQANLVRTFASETMATVLNSDWSGDSGVTLKYNGAFSVSSKVFYDTFDDTIVFDISALQGDIEARWMNQPSYDGIKITLNIYACNTPNVKSSLVGSNFGLFKSDSDLSNDISVGPLTVSTTKGTVGYVYEIVTEDDFEVPSTGLTWHMKSKQ